MRIVKSTAGWTAALAAAFFAVGPLQAQYSTKMPSTLRWGSGHVEVPSASVLPNMTVVGTYSGFLVNVDDELIINGSGDIVGSRGALKKWFSDASVSVGLFDRVELGGALPALDDGGSGNMFGLFGQLALLRPTPSGAGIGVSAGVRYANSPGYDDGIDQVPNRLAFPDVNMRETFVGHDDVHTNVTPYVVASAFLKGIESDLIPDNDFTFTLGWGKGLFSAGNSLPFYSFASSKGLFAGATMHMAVSERAILNLSGDWNGFDLNMGAQLDINGIRLGAHYLGTNYWGDTGIYRSPKFGALASIALCPNGGSMLCRANLIRGASSDTVRLPAPRPDTVIVTRDREVAPPLPTGTATDICLATGSNISVLVTAQGDTLVGPSRTSIRVLRQGGVVFAGDYAQGRTWYDQNQPITLDRRTYRRSGNEVRLNCPDLKRVGEYMGVPLFAMNNATEPYPQIYVPVRPGVWQMYESGLNATRG